MSALERIKLYLTISDDKTVINLTMTSDTGITYQELAEIFRQHYEHFKGKSYPAAEDSSA